MAIIQIKYSTANTAPDNGALVAGELAYSYVSNKLFVGNESTGAANVIGGEYYTTIINANTPLANANTIITRDQYGSFAANVITANSFVGTLNGDIDGNASTATQLQNPFTLRLVGNATGSASLDGSSDANLTVTLSNTSVTSGSYGNTRFIPTFTVGSDGRITSVSNVEIDFPGTADFAQNSYDHANSGYLHANSAHSLANTSNNTATAAGSYANSAFNLANLVNSLATYTSIHVNAAFDVANTGVDNWVRDAANSASSYANSSFVHANAAFDVANNSTIAYSHANSAFDKANDSIDFAVSTSLLVTGLWSNTAGNSDKLQAAYNHANSGHLTANAAFNAANGKLSSSGGTISGSLTVSGNLTVGGNVTYVNTNQLNIGDNILTLNADLGQSSIPTENAGIEVERGIYQNASILWNETNKKWQFTGNSSTSNIASAAAEVYANAAYDQSNSAYAIASQAQNSLIGSSLAANAAGTYANAAFVTANSAYNGTLGTHSNAAFLHANAAFDAANAATPQFTQSAFDTANLAWEAANTAYETGGIIAGSYANAAYFHANASYNFANTTSILTLYTSTHSNSAFDKANDVTSLALSAYALANSINATEGGALAQVAYDIANTAYNQSNLALYIVNTTSAGVATAAYDQANAAFQEANSKLDLTGGTLTGDLLITANLRVVGERAQFQVSSLSVDDNLIDISAGTIGTPSVNSGIRVIRGDENGVQLRWNERNDYWQFTNDGLNYLNIASQSAETYANAAFNNSNTSVQYAESAGDYANASFVIANVANEKAAAAYRHANSSFDYANTRYSSSGGDINGDVRVYGDLTVVGGVTYANTTTLIIADNILTLNAAISPGDSPAFDAGLEVDRGAETNVAFIWNESSDYWQFTTDGTNYFNVASQSAESYSNGAFQTANSSGVYANAAFAKSNTNANLIQDVYNTVNTDLLLITAAFDKANDAYDLANSKSTFYFDSFPPASPHEGDRWIDSDLGQEFIYVNDGDSLQWIELSAFVDQNLVDDNIYYILGNSRTGNDSDTVQSIFGVSINLLANTVYEFEASIAFKKTAGSNSHALALGFAGTATFNNVLYNVIHNGSGLNSPATPTSIMINTVSSTTVSSDADVDNHNVFLKGTISVGSAGSFTPQYRLTSSPGGAFDTLAGSYIKMEPVGSSNTNINIGTWY